MVSQHPFRRTIIKTAEVMAYVAVVLFTVLGFIAGLGAGLTGAASSTLLSTIVGTVVGFVSACGFSAIFFLLVDIAENTRRPAAS